MANKQGGFIWYELLTRDPEVAAKFYGSVIGWHATDSGQPAMDYRLLSMPGAGPITIGGLMKLPSDAANTGGRPGWLGYIGVDDVDASIAKIKAASGTVCMPAMDIPGVGRFAMLADPQGAAFYVMRVASNGTSTSFSPADKGHCGWNELSTKDWQKAFDFYADQFGWTKADAIDMGPMGTYQLFAAGGVQIGGMMNQPDFRNSAWLYYFTVDDIDAAATRIGAAGGTILHGPVQVPGGSWIINAQDPQGAMFALVGQHKM